MLNIFQGGRPVPSRLGGGDLDGDVYNITLNQLPDFRPDFTYPPASCDPVRRNGRHAEFLMEYITSDVRRCN